MKNKKLMVIYSVAGLSILCFPCSSSATSKITMVPNGSGSFVLLGANAAGVANIDVTVSYDPTFLADPRLSAQGGNVASMIDTPGEMSVHIVREDPTDPNIEISLMFGTTGDQPGVINFATASVQDTEGSKNAVPVEISAPPETAAVGPTSSPGAKEAPSPTSSATGKNDQPPNDGSQPAKSDRQTDMATDGNKTPSPSEEAAPKPPLATSTPPIESAQSPRTDIYGKSVLQRFKDFKGKRGLKEFAALFAPPNGSGMRQDPVIALSDGRTPLTITLDHPAIESFTVSGGRLLSLRKTDEGNWVITVMPDKGVDEAKLLVWNGKYSREIPLTVAPPAGISPLELRGIGAADFVSRLDSYLAGAIAHEGKKPAAALKYRYEYVFTANYLAVAGAPQLSRQPETGPTTPQSPPPLAGRYK
jgi:hypothetical protein